MKPLARTIAAWTLCLATSLAAIDVLHAAEQVSFRNDVMAVLSKSGCNLGTCHGNANGKGGFKLSLRGQDPQADHLALVQELFGRRIDRLQPANSLLLRKPTLDLAHEGGRRFQVESLEFQILRDWIAQGARSDRDSTPRLVGLEVRPETMVLFDPQDEVQLTAIGVFSDGQQRDVTRLAVYEPASRLCTVTPEGLVQRSGMGECTVLVRYLHLQLPVRLAFVPLRPDFAWAGPPPRNFVDDHVFTKLKSLRINPSPTAADHLFLRRAFLDLLGILPTADEAREFIADKRVDKRARLIDALLDRPEFAEFWALKWSDLLRNEERVLDRKGVQNFHAWIRGSLAENKPLDQFVAELVASRGSSYTEPASNYYRANRDAVTRAEATAQLFLGVRLQCAKCHNHPFDRWTQDDYYQWAGLFSRVQYKILENNRRDKNDKHEFDGEQIIWMDDTSELNDPRTDRPVQPKLLGAEVVNNDRDRLEQLAQWLTAADNAMFARTQVNRIWFNLMGQGIVEPIDDFRATNPPSNPALLDALAADFVEHGFDLRHTIRTITNSASYQASSEPNETNRLDELNFSRAYVRRLSAEQLLDALMQVTGAPQKFSNFPLGTRAGQLPGTRIERRRDERPTDADRFLTVFGKPPRLLTCECERSTETTLGQTLELLSGPALAHQLSADENRLSALLRTGKSSAELVESLYWTALSRPPRTDEAAPMIDYLNRSANRRLALEDITWALINSKEFLLRN